MDQMTRDLLDRVVARAAELRVRGAWAAEADDRRAAVVRWRLASSSAGDIVSAVPLVARAGQGRPGRWLDPGEEEEVHSRVRVGFDREDRPLIHEDDDSEFVFVHHTWRYWDDHLEETSFHGDEPHVTWLVEAGAVGVVRAERWVEQWVSDAEGRIGRVERAEAGENRWLDVSAATAEYDGDGQVLCIRRARGAHPAREDNRLAADAVVPAIERGLNEAQDLLCDEVIWTARAQRPERLRQDILDYVPRLADAFDAAIRAAQRETGPPHPFTATVRLNALDAGALPPGVGVGDVSWRNAVRARSPVDGEAVATLWAGRESGQVVWLELAPRCDDETMRLCRELNGALRFDARRAEAARAGAVVEALGEELTRRLNAPGVFPGAVPEFLADVNLSASVCLAEHRDRDRTRRLLGDERVDRFLESVRSRSRVRDPDPMLALRATADRDGLAELLSVHGIDAVTASRLANDVAELGLLLVEDAGARSRLGGPGLLPPGADWPHAAGERPLSFLGGIDLGELPAGVLRAQWPRDGWLLFYADLDNEEALGLIEPTSAADEGAPARVLVVAPGDAPAAAAPPAFLVERMLVLRERRVGVRAQLTLPDGFGAAQELGLPAADAVGYRAAIGALSAARLADLRQPHHWIGGHATGAQGETPDAGTTLLLHLEGDDALDFAFEDGGVIQFRIPDAALAAADWSQATAEPDSC